jgi:hypothetical protein
MRFAVATLAVLLAAPGAVAGYLDGKPGPDLMRILPAPPRPGTARAQDDRATFRQTRALNGTGRWALATRDVTDDRLTVFSCEDRAEARRPLLADERWRFRGSREVRLCGATALSQTSRRDLRAEDSASCR